MHHLQLSVILDLALKSDEIVELLEAFDMSVVYDFDRLNEGTEDIYWASAYGAGFQLMFNHRQVLKTIFAYVIARDGFSVVEPSIVGVPFHSSRQEAQRAFEGSGIPFKAGSAGNDWVKGQFSEYSVHYEFSPGGELALVTLMASDA